MRQQSDLAGRSFVVPPGRHVGHRVKIEREDRFSTDRWHCRCSCGETWKLPGATVERLMDAAGEPPF